ncbi:MAG: class I SAM-dependent methyltransferase [Bacteroidales bacterium]|nr:class I SAM-dependent methyltransferase [Bacteroidales bacterium]
MKSRNYISRLFPLLILLLISAGLLAQENKNNKGFVPEVGQQGKDVVWVPTPQELVDTMLSIANVTPDDYLIDLGSGDGRTVITAAKIGAHALGVEYNPEMVALSKRNAELDGVTDKAEFIEGDLYELDLSKATVITMFLLPEINLKLRPRLLNLKPGTRIVSNTFTMGEWEADYEVDTEENWNSWNTALLWIIPAKVEGTWKIGQDELSLTQEFQFIHGKLNNKEKSSPISDGRLRGNEITFKVNGALYIGTVNGTKMLGTATIDSDGRKWDWSATRSGS